MATLNSVTASPSTVNPGQSATIVPSVTLDPGRAARTAHVAVELEGQTGAADVSLPAVAAESVTYTTDPSKRGQPGYAYGSVDVGSLVATASGFTYTAP